MTACRLCPRGCGTDRETGGGFCRVGKAPTVARAALHMWEEPCLSGGNGSGTVFFSGCNLARVYCQNYPISRGQAGKEITKARLSEIFRELVGLGADNINLVTPTHFSDVIAETLRKEKPPVPVVWNCGGYESVETLRTLEGLIDVYMPDMKYSFSAPAARYSNAPDYPERAKAAILEMFRQRGGYVLDDRGLIKSGVIIRHLILPGNLENTFGVIDWAAETFRPGQVLFSLMSQFTPTENCAACPEINRPLTREEHERAIEYLENSGIEDGFYQDLGSVGESFIPPFDLTGV
ncbi:MAG: radical SAM protein [Oscillospiraceae bacterium]|nr:radical SAM protein [Oscillospiraceae bacterium]